MSIIKKVFKKQTMPHRLCGTFSDSLMSIQVFSIGLYWFIPMDLRLKELFFFFWWTALVGSIVLFILSLYLKDLHKERKEQARIAKYEQFKKTVEDSAQKLRDSGLNVITEYE